MGEGGERLYTYRYTVTTRMTYALRWAAMGGILMFHNCEGQSHKTVSTDHNFRREKTAEADSNRGPQALRAVRAFVHLKLDTTRKKNLTSIILSPDPDDY